MKSRVTPSCPATALRTTPGSGNAVWAVRSTQQGRPGAEGKVETMPEFPRSTEGQVAALCLICGAGGVFSPTTQKRGCVPCGWSTSYRRCPKCMFVVTELTPGWETAAKIRCTSCQKSQASYKFPVLAIGEV